MWKDIEGFEWLYQINEFGKIKSNYKEVLWYKGTRRIYKEKIMKTLVTNRGYEIIYLSKNGVKYKFYVHRLVAKAFIPNPDNKPQVNHLDCNRLNNHYKNLEWSTQKENMQYASKLGRMKNIGKKIKVNLSNNDIKFIRENYKPRDKEYSMWALSRKFNVSATTINDILKGKGRFKIK